MTRANGFLSSGMRRPLPKALPNDLRGFDGAHVPLHELLEGLAQRKADERRRNEKERELAKLNPEVPVVDTEHRRTHGIDRVRCRQKRAHVLHEIGQNLQWIRTPAAGYLHDEQADREGLSEIGKCEHEDVYQEREDES